MNWEPQHSGVKKWAEHEGIFYSYANWFIEVDVALVWTTFVETKLYIADAERMWDCPKNWEVV